MTHTKYSHYTDKELMHVIDSKMFGDIDEMLREMVQRFLNADGTIKKLQFELTELPE